MRGGTEAFAALSDEPIARHSRVVVVEALSARSVLVTPSSNHREPSVSGMSRRRTRRC